ncbi:hypothetical protein ACX0G7_12670 [Flavitalea antarctica]
MLNQSRLLSKTLVTPDRIELSTECLDALVAEGYVPEYNNRLVTAANQSLKMIYHLKSLDNVSNLVLDDLKIHGYHGIEAPLSALAGKDDLVETLRKLDLSLIIQISTSGASVDGHLHSFHNQLLKAIDYDPVLINSLSGVDHWGMDEKYEFTTEAIRWQNALRVGICHKLQRGTITCNPWETRDLLLDFPQLKICSDFSEWVMACGRLLTTDWDILRICAERCSHIMTRIADDQGYLFPGIKDARYEECLTEYEKWWLMIWLNSYAASNGMFTMSHFDPQFIQHPFHRPGEISYSSWMNERQSFNFQSLYSQAKPR